MNSVREAVREIKDKEKVVAGSGLRRELKMVKKLNNKPAGGDSGVGNGGLPGVPVMERDLHAERRTFYRMLAKAFPGLHPKDLEEIAKRVQEIMQRSQGMSIEKAIKEVQGQEAKKRQMAGAQIGSRR